jgi:hypothetical protein
VALVKSGYFIEDAIIDINPKPIPRKAELLIYSAEPKNNRQQECSNGTNIIFHISCFQEESKTGTQQIE